MEQALIDDLHVFYERYPLLSSQYTLTLLSHKLRCDAFPIDIPIIAWYLNNCAIPNATNACLLCSHPNACLISFISYAHRLISYDQNIPHHQSLTLNMISSPHAQTPRLSEQLLNFIPASNHNHANLMMSHQSTRRHLHFIQQRPE
jgi:hypothetical protein